MSGRTGISGALRAITCALALSATACGGSGGGNSEPVTIGAGSPTVVSYFSEVAIGTINQPAASTGTPEERQPIYAFDLATVHVAMYDAVVAIDGGREPYYARPTAPTEGASQQAAAAAAAYGVLRGLFPSRSASYQAAYDTYVGTLPAGSAKTLGLAVGAQVATGVLAARANDGRDIALAPFVGGTTPGAYRGPGLVGRTYSSVRPFALTSAAQVRAPGPLSLTSSEYATVVNETQSLGGATSTTRTAAQAASARFHTEGPATFWPRNLRIFTMTSRSLADQAYLGALLWVTHADATIGCFESKYHYLFWRPSSAINFADTDGNPATTADPAWTVFLPTPPHPEYPAAHACVAAAAREALRRFYNTPSVAFDFTSTASGTTHHYADVDALLDDITIARIAGGMHFRSSIRDGAELGKAVVGQALATRFRAR